MMSEKELIDYLEAIEEEVWEEVEELKLENDELRTYIKKLEARIERMKL